MPNGNGHKAKNSCEKGGCDCPAAYQVIISEPSTGEVIHSVRLCLYHTGCAYENARRNYLLVGLTPLRGYSLPIPVALYTEAETRVAVVVTR